MISFKKASLEYCDNVFKWLDEPHVKEFWDNSQNHRDDILIFMDGRKQPSPYFDGMFDYWIGLVNEQPYCLIMTSEIKENTDLSDLWRSSLSRSGKTFSIDFMIGNRNFIGKGLASPTLKAFTSFIHENVDHSVDTFFIDPVESNTRAKHVYEKAGFQCIGDFQRDCHSEKDVKHLLMVKKIFNKGIGQEQERFQLDLLHGNHILPAISLLNEWSIEAFQKPPYHYAGGFSQDQHAMFLNDSESLVVLAKNRNGQLIGMAASIPFTSPGLKNYFESFHKEMYQEFSASGFDPFQMFYISYLLTSPEYQGDPSLSLTMFEAIQNWAISLGKKQICCWEHASYRVPKSSKIETWKEDVGGFRRMDLNFRSSWPTFQIDGSIKEEEEHIMDFFLRSISTELASV